MASSDSKIAKIQDSYQQLSTEANSLNESSDMFTKSVGVLDEAIKRLNVGITVWINTGKWEQEENYRIDQLGYAKVKGIWGIAIRILEGSELSDFSEEKGLWLFADAPRDMRLDAVDKIPELIEALSKSAKSLAGRVRTKAVEAQELAAAIGRENPPGRMAQAFRKAADAREGK